MYLKSNYISPCHAGSLFGIITASGQIYPCEILENKLIKNYGIGAQIIKFLNIKKMILVTRSKKKVIGLDGYGIKITKQEIIK